MVSKTIKTFLITLISLTLLSCNDYHLGNNVYFQPMYEAIDVGNPFGSCLYIGKKEGYYEKFLVHSEVISYYQKDNLIYVKQKFDPKGFKNHILNDLEYLKNKNIKPLYIPKEIYALYLKDTVKTKSDHFIENSNFYKNRVNNGVYNYYVVDIKTYSVKSFFKEDDFLDYLEKNEKSFIVKEL